MLLPQVTKEAIVQLWLKLSTPLYSYDGAGAPAILLSHTTKNQSRNSCQVTIPIVTSMHPTGYVNSFPNWERLTCLKSPLSNKRNDNQAP